MAVTIREACEQDLAALVELYNHYIVETPITFDLLPYTIEQRQQSWFSHYSHQGRYRLLVAEKNQTIVGYASSSKFAAKAAYDTSVEASIYVAAGQTKQQIGSHLYAALFQLIEKEDIHCVYAGITLPNDASIAIHQKFGFRQAGIFREVGRKFNQYWDVAWYEKIMPS